MKGPLRVSGRKILDAGGKPVRLTGLNDAALVPTGDYSHPSTAAADTKAWGFNSVRVLATWQNWEPTAFDGTTHHWDTAYEAAVKAKVTEYTSKGIAVILSPMQQHHWTDLPWQGNAGVRGQGFPHWMYPNASQMTESEARCAFWSNLPPGVPGSYWGNLSDYLAHTARIFAANDLVVGIEPFNEPYNIGWCATGNLDGFYAAAGRAIQAVNKDVLIFFSDTLSPGGAKAMQAMPPVRGGVYAFHSYAGSPSISTYLARAGQLGAPAWCGEFVDATPSMLATLKADGAGWSKYAHEGTPGGLTKGGQLVDPAQLSILQAGR